MTILQNIFTFVTVLLFVYIFITLINSRNELIATLLGESFEADITKTQTETFVEGYDQVGIDATKYKVSEDSSSAKNLAFQT